MVRQLLVVCPPDELVDRLDELDIDFHLCRSPLQALDAIEHWREQHTAVQRHLDGEPPMPIVAYGERLFGRATTGQSARIAYDGPQIILADTTDANRSQRLETALVWQAASALRVWSVLDVSYPDAVEHLRDAMAGKDVPGVTFQRGKVTS